MSFVNGLKNAVVVSLAMWIVIVAVAVHFGSPALHLGHQAMHHVKQLTSRVL
jgi:hypothetical protein